MPADPVSAGPRGDLPGVDRLLALSDGVVAIAITLLVLQLNVPLPAALHHPDSASELAGQLRKGGDQLISYVISFYVIAQFWLVHHRVFRRITGQQEGLAWWNFAFLFTITITPPSTAGCCSRSRPASLRVCPAAAPPECRCDQDRASTRRGAAPKFVSATPQSVKPAAR